MERFNTYERAERLLIALWEVFGEIKGLSFSDSKAILMIKNDLVSVEKGCSLDD